MTWQPVRNLRIKNCGLLLALAASPFVVNAGASQAVLFIDFEYVSPTRTLIRSTGSLDLTGVPNIAASVNFTALGTNSATGINVNSDVLRFSGTNTTTQTVAGKNYSLTGPANPFTASIVTVPSPNPADCTINGNCFATPASDITNTRRIILNFGDTSVNNVVPDSVFLPNSYVNNAPINNSFYINRGLSEIGLSAPTLTYTLSGGINDTIVLRQVPGPLPILGAAAAFGFSRRLRSRLRRPSSISKLH